MNIARYVYMVMTREFSQVDLASCTSLTSYVYVYTYIAATRSVYMYIEGMCILQWTGTYIYEHRKVCVYGNDEGVLVGRLGHYVHTHRHMYIYIHIHTYIYIYTCICMYIATYSVLHLECHYFNPRSQAII